MKWFLCLFLCGCSPNYIQDEVPALAIREAKMGDYMAIDYDIDGDHVLDYRAYHLIIQDNVYYDVPSRVDFFKWGDVVVMSEYFNIFTGERIK